jgi:hypothetical protein
MSEERDPYLSLLGTQLNKLSEDLVRLNQESERIHNAIEAASKEREILTAAMSHYRDFLSSRGGERGKASPTDSSQSDNSELPPIEKIILRPGTKRKHVLEDIASEPRGLTAHEVAGRLEIPVDVVRNIIWADQKLQLLILDGERTMMTDRGYELLMRHGFTRSRPAAESPQGDPGSGQPRSDINDQESAEADTSARKEGGI